MAKIKKVVKKAAPVKPAKKIGRPAKEGKTQAEKNEGKVPVVVHFSVKQRAMLKLVSMGTGQSVSDVLRDLAMNWAKENLKKAKSLFDNIDDIDDVEDEDEEVTETETEEDDDEDEEDEDEESDDEDEDDDDDEDDDE